MSPRLDRSISLAWHGNRVETHLCNSTACPAYPFIQGFATPPAPDAGGGDICAMTPAHGPLRSLVAHQRGRQLTGVINAGALPFQDGNPARHSRRPLRLAPHAAGAVARLPGGEARGGDGSHCHRPGQPSSVCGGSFSGRFGRAGRGFASSQRGRLRNPTGRLYRGLVRRARPTAEGGRPWTPRCRRSLGSDKGLLRDGLRYRLRQRDQRRRPPCGRVRRSRAVGPLPLPETASVAAVSRTTSTAPVSTGGALRRDVKVKRKESI